MRLAMLYNAVELYNVQEILYDERGEATMLTRLPDALRLTLNDFARDYALQTTGCEIRFNLVSDRATVQLQSPEEPTIVEIYQGPFLTDWKMIDTNTTSITIERPLTSESLRHLHQQQTLPFDPQLTRILLPWNAATRLIGIDGNTATPRPEQSPVRKYLAYGSSITHGYCGIRPTDTYAQRIAHLLGVDLINLGLAGGAHLEPAMADYIAQRTDWDFAILELGINVIGDIEADEFEHRVDRFLTAIGHQHPNKWIFCTDLFTCDMDVVHDPKITIFRTVVRNVVERLHMPKLIHISGAELLTSIDGLTSDLVHPAPAGMDEIARNLVRRMANTITDG
jgi:lysophospholipase L1-like esterase